MNYNPVEQFLLTAGFVIGGVVGNLLLVQYWARSAWRSSPTGKVMLSLFAVIAVTYDLAVCALLWPAVFDGGLGLWIRIGAWLVIDGVLIALYVLLIRAQRRTVRAPRQKTFITPSEGARHRSTE